MKKKLVLLICYILLEIADHGQSLAIECEKEGFTATGSENCAVYYYCVKNSNGEFYAVKFQCPLGEEFSLLILKCVPEATNECGKLPGIPIDDPMLANDFVCPSSGRFPDVESSDCKSYYMCSSELAPVLNNCPSTTIFSWESMKCVMPTSFTCPNAITTITESSTTTTEPSTTTEENADPNSFVCKTEGRFANPQSIDCKSYYLCAKTVDGNIDAILSQCPSTTIFSPEAQKCLMSSQYECPALTTPTDQTTTGTATTTTNEETNSESSEPNAFECTDIGLFPDPDQEDCTTYYLCTISITGIYETVLKQCPSPTIFSPVDQGCVDKGYQCKAGSTVETNGPSTIESTFSYTTIVEITTQDSSVSEPTVTFEFTTSSSTIDTEHEYTDLDSTTESITGHTDVTTAQPPPFICLSHGRFPNPKSTDCKSYYLCTENTEGFFDATFNQCPSVTIFNPVTGKCVQPTDYQCSAVETTTFTELTEKPSTVVTTVLPPTVTIPESPTTVCTTDATISTTDTTTANDHSSSATDEPSSTIPAESFVCFAYGRFPDPKSTDCKGYYLCTEDIAGLLQATLNQCPSVTIFHPEKAKCVQPTDYQCSTLETTTPEVTEEISTVEPTLSSSVTTTESPEEPSTPGFTTQAPPHNGSFSCPAVGRFPDPTSADCKGYYLCSTTAAGTYEAVHTQCPSVTIFSAEQNRCVLMSQYQCPTPITTSTVPTTVTSPDNFICKSIGRHPDSTQPGCSQYKYCLLTATNEFLEYTFKCPLGSYFSPRELRCSTGYSCPVLTSTVTSEQMAELSNLTTPTSLY